MPSWSWSVEFPGSLPRKPDPVSSAGSDGTKTGRGCGPVPFCGGGMKPIAIDLFTGAHGWAEGLVREGFEVIGFDIEDMCGQFGWPRPDDVHLVLQDVLTLHGSQFKNASLIVASPPCQEYSYMAMPWSLAKQKAREYRDGTRDTEDLNRLFNACFRIQREACEAAGRHIPMVVENVRGAQPWVGRARWNFGSFYLWGDVPALMPPIKKYKTSGMNWSDQSKKGQDFTRIAGQQAMDGLKNPGFRFDGSGRSFQTESVNQTVVKVQSESGRRTDPGKGARFTSKDCGVEGIKQRGSGREWCAGEGKISRTTSSKSPARKAASALIAKIPEPLSRHIAKTYYPREAA